MKDRPLYGKRLTIVPLDAAALAARRDGEHDPHMASAYGEMMAGVLAHPEAAVWFTSWDLRLADGTVVGDAGFKGPPDGCGAVEIGYGVDEAYRNNGYAGEATARLCDWAFAQGAKLVRAQTEVGNLPSERVLTKAGFVCLGPGGEGRLWEKKETAFRPMRRVNQQLSRAETETVFRECEMGTLAVLGDHGYPYAVPLNHVYLDGALYFHCAREGHKLDAVARCDKASFTVVAVSEVLPETLSTRYKSAVAFGRARLVVDEEEKRRALMAIAKRFAPDHPGAGEREIRDGWRAVEVLCLDIEHMTGKIDKGSLGKR